MLDKGTVYRKTARGVAAVAERQGGLTPRQRTLLILIDGRRDGPALEAFGAACGNVAEVLEHLLAQGYVERVTPAAIPAPAPPTAPPQAALPLAPLRSKAVRRLTDLAGPLATDMCLRLEKTGSVEELRAAVHRLEGLLAQMVGARRAAAYVAEVDEWAGAAPPPGPAPA